MLIGVASIDVIAENLPQPLQDQVYAEFQSRIRGTQVAPANIPLTCNYQVLQLPVALTCILNKDGS